MKDFIGFLKLPPNILGALSICFDIKEVEKQLKKLGMIVV